MMNDEDLEARLARWQPAEPPPDFLRRLRAAEPPTRRGRFWANLPWLRPMACAGLLVAAAFFCVVGRTPSLRPSPAGPVRVAPGDQVSAHLPGGLDPRATTNTSPAAFSWVNGISRSEESFRGGEAFLHGNLDARIGCVFHLERPTGPIRLDWDRPSPDHDFMRPTFGKFQLNISDPF